ncbi:hypothetical protein [Pseudomonas sp. CGJS7]|uniref:hypothetical protein n=1 Tax=Pseudomonas sp. CGJS7 TaxID=3109348 RepID=UPI00300999A2
MPDRNSHPPRDWGEAFALLPQEPPPADGWARMAASLAATAGAAEATSDPTPTRAEPRHIQAAPRRRVATRPVRRWAIAAMLAAALPLGVWLALNAQRPTPQAPASDPVAAAPTASTAVTATDAKPDASAAVAVQTPAVSDTGPRAASPNDSDRRPLAAPDTRQATADPIAPNRSADAIASPRRSSAAAERIAKATAANRPSTPSRVDDATATPTGDTATRLADTSDNSSADTIARQLRDLQAESAQLEALVALTRDERVGNASATVMSADLDQRLGLIDAGLIDAALSPEQRLALWQQRVGALRSLAGVESTQRWLAAHGERYGDALVRVD